MDTGVGLRWVAVRDEGALGQLMKSCYAQEAMVLEGERAAVERLDCRETEAERQMKNFLQCSKQEMLGS